jgi:hypothetical protein
MLTRLIWLFFGFTFSVQDRWFSGGFYCRLMARSPHLRDTSLINQSQHTSLDFLAPCLGTQSSHKMFPHQHRQHHQTMKYLFTTALSLLTNTGLRIIQEKLSDDEEDSIM